MGPAAAGLKRLKMPGRELERAEGGRAGVGGSTAGLTVRWYSSTPAVARVMPVAHEGGRYWRGGGRRGEQG